MELKKNEFQGELRKQREQLDRIQSSHSFQLENVHKLHQDEKARPSLPIVLSCRSVSIWVYPYVIAWRCERASAVLVVRLSPVAQQPPAT